MIRNLYAAHAGHVVLVLVSLAALLDAAEPPALGPGQVGVLRAVEIGADAVIIHVPRQPVNKLCNLATECQREHAFLPESKNAH